MARSKRGKKPLLQNPVPAASSHANEEVENVQVEEENSEEVSAVKNLNDPKSLSSSSSSDEEDEDEQDSETNLATNPNLKTTVSEPNDPKPHFSDDDEGDDEEEESEPASLRKLKPISSKSKKTVPSASFATPLKLSTTAKKRHIESEKDSKKKKKMKKEVDDEGEEESERSTEKNNVPFQRVWSEADEVIILKSMIESEKKGVQPLSDLSGFLESIKESLSVKDAKPDQLKRKIRRLKVKYLKKAEVGEDHVLLNSHDQHLHGLSKEIWGVTTKTVAGISEMKLEGSNGIFHPSLQEWICSSNIKNMVVGESFLKQGLDLIGELKKKDLEQKLRDLIVEELKLYLRRLELTRELIIAALDAWSSNASEQ